MEIPFASKLRKDQLEAAIKDLLFADGTKAKAISVAPKQGPRDVDRGLRLDLPVVHNTSNKDTELFIERAWCRNRSAPRGGLGSHCAPLPNGLRRDAEPKQRNSNDKQGHRVAVSAWRWHVHVLCIPTTTRRI